MEALAPNILVQFLSILRHMVQVFTIPFPPVCDLCSFSQIFASRWLDCTFWRGWNFRVIDLTIWKSCLEFPFLEFATSNSTHTPSSCCCLSTLSFLCTSAFSAWIGSYLLPVWLLSLVHIHLNHSNVSWFHVESHNNDSVADWFISDECSRDFPMNPDCYSWHFLSRSTWVYYRVAIQCC